MSLIPWWVYAAIAVALAAAGTTVVVTYNHAIARAEKAETAAEGWKKIAVSAQKATAKLQGDFDASDEEARQRGIRERESARRVEGLSDELAKIKARKPAAAASLACVVDDSVRVLRRINAGCSPDLELPCPPDGPGTTGHPEDAGRNSGGPGPGGGETPRDVELERGG